MKIKKKISETKSQFFERINKIDKPLGTLIRGKTEDKSPISELEKKEINTDPTLRRQGNITNNS